MRELGELGLIRRIREGGTGAPAAGVPVGIGDDAAMLAVTPGSALLATTDLVIEDVHFRRAWATPADVGWKAMAVNLSDIAAMGGVPRWALVALAVPGDTPSADVDAFYAGLREAAAPHGVAIVGGDTSQSPRGWLVNVTLLGEHPARRACAPPRARETLSPSPAPGPLGGGPRRARAGSGRGTATRSARHGDRRGHAGPPPTARAGRGGPMARRRARRARDARLLGRRSPPISGISAASRRWGRAWTWRASPSPPAPRRRRGRSGQEPIQWATRRGRGPTSSCSPVSPATRSGCPPTSGAAPAPPSP